MEYRKAAAETRAIWALGNEFLQQQAPWTQLRNNRELAGRTVSTVAMLLRLAAIVALPIIPDSAAAILRGIGLDAADAKWPASVNDLAMDANRSISVPAILFQKIDNDTISAWKRKFLPDAGPAETT
jgi:methionyl-tRNA synthetase